MIDRLAANGIDLTKMPVEVAPIAHYHMGGVAADVRMQTEVPGLLVAGEAVGGANGANRLSGNAITEALVFGRQAGRTAAARAKAMTSVPAANGAARATVDLIRSAPPKDMPNSAEMLQRLQATMSDDVGPLRTGDKLERALGTIGELTQTLGDRPFGDAGAFDMQRLDWFDLRNMLTVARAVTRGRGAADRKPRRASARGFPRDAAAVARQPDDPAARREPRHRAGARLSGRRSPRNERDRHPENLARPEQGRQAIGKPTRCRSSAASRCSTGCAGSASTRTRRWPSAFPASTPMPARNA